MEIQRKFRINSNIADVRLSVESGSLESLFKNSLFGMDEVLKKGFCKSMDGNLIESEIEITSYNTTALLLDFLSEVLTISHITHVIFCSAQFITLTNKYLLARISGSRVDKFDKDLKSVSYYETDVTRNKNGNYKTSIIFDYR